MIFETIVTTLNSDNSVHIAPMGVQYASDRTIMIAPFIPSTTLDNLKQRLHAVVNMTDDVRIFAGCLTGRYHWPTVAASTIPGQRLETALAHLELRVKEVQEDKLRPRFYCEILHQENHKSFRGFNRAQAAILETAILVSRLSMLPTEKVDTEIKYLEIAIDKTAGPNEREAWEWLLEKITEFRKHQAATENMV